jgi:hypothetical protein
MWLGLDISSLVSEFGAYGSYVRSNPGIICRSLQFLHLCINNVAGINGQSEAYVNKKKHYKQLISEIKFNCMK